MVSVAPDEGCGVIDGLVTVNKWDKNDNKNVANSDDIQILIK